MSKKLIQMTWPEVQVEMSIAGSPAKITDLGRNIMQQIGSTIDATNRAELTNAELMLQRVLAEIRHMQRMYDRNH